MAQEIRFEELPMKNYFSEVFEDLISKLTHKLPKLRLGNPLRGGAQEIKNHPFFRGVNWDSVYQMKEKPPIIPDPSLRNSNKGEFVSTDTYDYQMNPYVLLGENFSSKLYNRDVMLYDKNSEYRKVST